MSKVKRVFPGPTNGLINWMEQNFHEIDGFVATFNMKDGTTMTVYDAESYLQAVGLVEIGKDTIHQLAHDDEFSPKK
ncbi:MULTISPECIES: hypothetical protein [Bacillus amyloliquefaciens group]|uniref:hypothetical protein n=1 Tax=Bacillus amyloliquefaciens group TaxID=1938374 RepID=UPI001AE761F6|nr:MULTISPECIES: hypothetical protein [Bacillus amyloliquefaciens group]MEC5260926.1 hypothetical protein [Bacillus amyloliquefaciens]UZD74749.1 hypothetical protein OM992_03360 [Bacillus siamensis]WJM60720.1 hypothetical protein QTN46_14610 [Bacillus amyloliquefaciens]